jgi:hypothetical protein
MQGNREQPIREVPAFEDLKRSEFDEDRLILDEKPRHNA